MAEARAAVTVQPYRVGLVSSTDDEYIIRLNKEAFKYCARKSTTWFRNRVWVMRNFVRGQIYPARPIEWTLAAGVPAFVMLGDNRTLSPFAQILWNMPKRVLPAGYEMSAAKTIASVSLVAGTAVFFGVSLLRRCIFRQLLSYRGWMFEPAGHESIVTKIWGMLVMLMRGPYVTMLGHQSSLPTLPVPNVEDTVRRHLDSMRPLVDENEYQELETLAKEYVQTVAPKINRYLKLKSCFASNYVTDWWEKYVYLSGRSEIMIFSNYYVLGGLDHVYDVQSASCASSIHFILQFYFMLERETIPPLVMRGIIPMCMNQYERMFGTTRIPGEEVDSLRHTPGSRHIVFMRRGQYYSLDIVSKTGLRLTPKQLQAQIEWIMKHADRHASGSDSPSDGPQKLAAMTGNKRTVWHNFRKKHMGHGINRASLEIIDTAIFVVSLDHEQPQATKDVDELSMRGRSLFHGNGVNRWFDKSFTLVSFPNGRMGMNVEHSWADAPVMGHMWEWVAVQQYSHLLIGDDGNCIAQADEPSMSHASRPAVLDFSFDEEATAQLNTAYDHVWDLINDIDLRIVVHNEYGKGFMKKCNMSPDSFIQAILQAGYKRDTGDFAMTYESSMTRIYRNGRTETVRAASKELLAFIRSLADPNVKRFEKIDLMQKSSKTHQALYKKAMAGQGVDRHLFAMMVCASAIGVESPYLKKAVMASWRLSTSQQPQQQLVGVWDIKDPSWRGVVSPGGGFGPVHSEGYGVSYMVVGESHFYMHISSHRKSAATDTKRFAKNILEASKEIQHIFL